jgi:RNA recognition motif-containing protein
VSVRVYVGNLPFRTTDDELRRVFEKFGAVSSADVIRYKGSGRSKGYAFVVMTDEVGAQKAIEAMNEKDYEGRILKVRVANPRENYPRKPGSEERGPRSIRIGID